MHRALYRKWRPVTFDDVIGQTSIVTALKSQLLHNKVGHAYIFTGTRGTGKTTCAKIFAKAVNCESLNEGNPCTICPVCQGIDNGSVLDVVEIDAASNNGVDNIRDLRDETAYTPSVGKYKVYIIDEVHMLSTAAFNALLKIMEEPPSHVIFILATTEIHKVPATILSRCQRYDFVRISIEDITNRLLYVANNEEIQLSQDGAQLIARLADGAMRDALSILDTCSGVTNNVDIETVRRMAGVTDRSYLFSLSEHISNCDAPSALALIATLREQSVDIKRLCDELILHYRNLMLAGISGGAQLLNGVSAEEEKKYMQASQTITKQAAIRGVREFCSAIDKMGKSADARIELELAVFALCDAPVENVVYAQGQNNVQYSPPPQQALQTPINHSLAPPPMAQNYAQQQSPQPHVMASKTDNEPAQTKPQPTAQVVQGTAPAEPQAETKEQSLEPFALWEAVLEAMQQKDQLLYVNMKNSKAYFDGKRIRIDGSDLFLEYMRQNKYSNALIRQTIAEVTGRQYAIGPYETKKAVATAGPCAETSIAELEAQGVPIIYHDK